MSKLYFNYFVFTKSQLFRRLNRAQLTVNNLALCICTYLCMDAFFKMNDLLKYKI